MRLFLLVLSLLLASCSGLFFKKYRLFGDDSREGGGLFGRGRPRGRGCYRPPVSPCYKPPVAPPPRKIVCGYAPSGYGHNRGYLGSGSQFGHSGIRGGGYQTLGFKGSPPIHGFGSHHSSPHHSSREIHVGVGKFKLSKNPHVSSNFGTFGSSGFSKTPISGGPISTISSREGSEPGSFSGFSTGYGGHTGKVNLANIHSSLEKK